MRDLEIRGAGDLLGAEQSGHAALGFELYVEMLNEAVAELTGQARVAVRPVRVDARVDAYVPATTSRPRRSRSTSTAASRWRSTTTSLRELRAATADRYGSGCRSRPRTCSGSRRASSRWRSWSGLPRSSGRSRDGRGRQPRGRQVRALRGIAETAVYSRPRGRRSRSAPRASRGRSRSPMLSLPLAGPPEHANRPRPRPLRTNPEHSVTRS